MAVEWGNIEVFATESGIKMKAKMVVSACLKDILSQELISWKYVMLDQLLFRYL